MRQQSFRKDSAHELPDVSHVRSSAHRLRKNRENGPRLSKNQQSTTQLREIRLWLHWTVVMSANQTSWNVTFDNTDYTVLLAAQSLLVSASLILFLFSLQIMASFSPIHANCKWVVV